MPRVPVRKMRQRVCKPGSVHAFRRCATIPLGLPLPTASSNQPGRRTRAAPYAVPIRSCSRWGLPCQPCCQGRGALLPHRFALAAPKCGGLFSVALSLIPDLRPKRPGVTRHRCPAEPGLSSATDKSADAVARPSDALPPKHRLRVWEAGAPTAAICTRRRPRRRSAPGLPWRV